MEVQCRCTLYARSVGECKCECWRCNVAARCMRVVYVRSHAPHVHVVDGMRHHTCQDVSKRVDVSMHCCNASVGEEENPANGQKVLPASVCRGASKVGTTTLARRSHNAHPCGMTVHVPVHNDLGTPHREGYQQYWWQGASRVVRTDTLACKMPFKRRVRTQCRGKVTVSTLVVLSSVLLSSRSVFFFVPPVPLLSGRVVTKHDVSVCVCVCRWVWVCAFV